MKPKKKVKTKNVKTPKRPLISNGTTKKIIAKLKASKMPKTVIARALGYSSHNTITRWYELKALPLTKVKEIERLLKMGM